MKIAVALRHRYNADVSIKDVALYPTVRSFAAHLRRLGLAGDDGPGGVAGGP
jgi:hypothetical protein